MGKTSTRSVLGGDRKAKSPYARHQKTPYLYMTIHKEERHRLAGLGISPVEGSPWPQWTYGLPYEVRS